MVERIKRVVKVDEPDLGDEIKGMARFREELPDNRPVEFINTGSTMLNLAGSGRGRSGGWARGRVINVVGDGSTGKTLLALELSAILKYGYKGKESAYFPKVKNVRIVYNNVEGVMDFDTSKMYGFSGDEIEWRRSTSLEGFGASFGKEARQVKDGTMLLYILDSFDSLSPIAEIERFEKAQKKMKDGDDDVGAELDGSYNLEKQKYISQFFRAEIVNKMVGKDITLFIISQVRSKIGITFGKKVYRTGGKALDFYTHQVCWLYEREKLKKAVFGEEVVYGIRVRGKFERNKVSKPYREAEFIVLFDYGIDDIGSMINYYWGPKKETLNFQGKDYSRPRLVSYIEDCGLEDDLRMMVEEKWQKVEEAAAPDRKAKFPVSK
jgi:RecA/RadA recombinase